MESIEFIFESGNVDELKTYKESLMQMQSPNLPLFCKNKLQQALYLIDGVILTIENNRNSALKKFLSGIKQTIPVFDLESYDSHDYNKLELQLLMNIGVIK